MPTQDNSILTTALHSEVESRFLTYALSTIVSRSLPDVRDGLKPVHRRILFAMWEMGLGPTAKYPQERGRRRRGAREVPPPRRPGCLRRHGQDGPGLLSPLSARRRLGKLRQPRRRPGSGHALYRGPALADRRRAPGRDRQGHRRLPPELRQLAQGAACASRAVPPAPRERHVRHRRGHELLLPAAQYRRGDRRPGGHDRQSEHRGEGPPQVHQGPRLPDSRPDPELEEGAQGDLPVGLRRHQDPRGIHASRTCPAAGRRSCSPPSPIS